MTTFEMKQQEAKKQSQAAMKPYGLEINMTRSSWYYTDEACTRGVMTTYTKHYPVKGNKALIEQLRAAGYRVEIIGNRDAKTRARCMEFWAEVTTPISVKDGLDKNDILEYAQEQGSKQAGADLLLLLGPDAYEGSAEEYDELMELLTK